MIAVIYDLGDGGIVKHGFRCMAYITCAKLKEEEVVVKVLVLSHAKFLRSESGFL